MNILIIPSWYTTPENPISGIFFKEQALALKENFERNNNYDKVFVLFIENFDIKNIKTYIKRKNINFKNEDGIPTLRMKILRIPRLHKINIFRGARKIRYAVKLASKKWHVNFDLIHIHSALQAGLWYSNSNLEIPYVITEHHTNYSQNLITKVQKKYLSVVFNNAEAVISVGIGLAKELSKYTNNKIQIIYNIVTNKYKTYSSSSKRNSKFTIFSLGVNARKKGFDVLLISFKNFIEAGNSGVLIIAGLEENEKNWLLSMDIPNNILKNVVLLGKLSRIEVFEYMNKCDCFALVSRYETFGVVFAEAMYSGKPVIASSTGGPDSFVNDQNGILVPVDDIIETTKAITFMSKNYKQFNSETIKKFAEDNFSPESICNKIIEIYKEILRDEKTI